MIDAGEALPGRRRNRPLPNLYEVHPEARLAPLREVGLCTVAVDEVIGTAVQGVAQRGLDFQPLPAFRSANWRGRLQRIRAALDRLETLPPADRRAEDGRGVLGRRRPQPGRRRPSQRPGGHRRRRAIRGWLPGQPVVLPGSLAAVLVGSDQIRAVGSWPVHPSDLPPTLEWAIRRSKPRRTIPTSPGDASALRFAGRTRVLSSDGETARFGSSLPPMRSTRRSKVLANRDALEPVGTSLSAVATSHPTGWGFLADAFRAPLLYVRGNHDRRGPWPSPTGIPAPSSGWTIG